LPSCCQGFVRNFHTNLEVGTVHGRCVANCKLHGRLRMLVPQKARRPLSQCGMPSGSPRF
jgi:hypothetical protein